MVTCTECGDEIERNVFCCAGCKIRHFRKKGKPEKKDSKPAIKKKPKGKCLLHGEEPKEYCESCRP